MSVHEQFADDLALYALNALEGDDRAKLEQHLATCPDCRRELEQLRGDGALLAFSTLGPKPPARSRQRLLDAVANEASTSAPKRPRIGRAIWAWTGWAVATVAVAVAFALWQSNSTLRQSLDQIASLNESTIRQNEEFLRVLAPIRSPKAQRVTLIPVKTPPQPQGKVFYLRENNSLVLLANNLAALPPQKAYELWLIPTQGAPIPAGVFKPDAHGAATVVNPPLPPGTDAKEFAITVENEAGATTPTMPIVMMGTGE